MDIAALLAEIETLRQKLHGAGFSNYEELLRVSQELDALIVAYQRAVRENGGSGGAGGSLHERGARQ
ncbi:aspartyl-phosphate phosphatase Spo0E family protein [Desulfovirgula thermocuniculi]|uniref:aspartyl-phosphate phosphatase Spo0E family protein n=1 Tax=Desulfovirgula thermocuniculi TaxID=348842 RepID=UPI000406DE28|nr:aspartyl-phosphate phosphatase Spo0E family protein [Desulfovirgula thermocuniculi]